MRGDRGCCGSASAGNCLDTGGEGHGRETGTAPGFRQIHAEHAQSGEGIELRSGERCLFIHLWRRRRQNVTGNPTHYLDGGDLVIAETRWQNIDHHFSPELTAPAATVALISSPVMPSQLARIC